jgi:hypothetical protein
VKADPLKGLLLLSLSILLPNPDPLGISLSCDPCKCEDSPAVIPVARHRRTTEFARWHHHEVSAFSVPAVFRASRASCRYFARCMTHALQAGRIEARLIAGHEIFVSWKRGCRHCVDFVSMRLIRHFQLVSEIGFPFLPFPFRFRPVSTACRSFPYCTPWSGKWKRVGHSCFDIVAPAFFDKILLDQLFSPFAHASRRDSQLPG